MGVGGAPPRRVGTMTVLESPAKPRTAEPVLRVRGLSVRYPLKRSGFWGRRSAATAVEDISFEIAPGETLGLVGESGSGKTTIARAVLRQVEAVTGQIVLNGVDVTRLRGEALRRLRAGMQVVLQDPYASLNPRMRVLDLVAEPLLVHGRVRSIDEAREQVVELLRLVGLPADAHERYPHAFSGGQRQRIGIARALALRPSLIVADEPVSALDVSIRAQVVNLMRDLQVRFGISYLFIAHDLSIVRHVSHRVAILYAGRIVELAACETIYQRPAHPYTRSLIAAVPVPDPGQKRWRDRAFRADDVGEPGAADGCAFRARCPRANGRCSAVPPLVEIAPGHLVACWNRG